MIRCVTRFRTAIGVLLTLACIASSRASAQPTNGDSAHRALAVGSAPPVGAPVVLHGDTLFRLYGDFGPFSPAQRASAASMRLAHFESTVGSGKARVLAVATAGRHDLVVGDSVLMTVLDADAAAVGQPRDSVARRYADIAQRALVGAAHERSARQLALDAAYAAAATLVLLLLLLLMSAGFPRLYSRIEAVRRARLPAIRIQQFELLSAERLSRLLLAAARTIRVALTLILLYFYVPLVLSFFPWTAALSHSIVGYALKPLVAVWTSFIGYLPDLFTIIAIVIVTRYLLVLIHAVFRAVGSGAITIRGFYPDWAEPTYRIARLCVFAFAAVVLFPHLPGAQSDAFKGISVFVGVLLSFGSSGAVGNVVAGVVLIYTRAFQLGDRVQIGETMGDVIERTLLVTRIRTIKNVEITIPNGAVLAGQVVNYSAMAASRGLIIHTSVTICYDAPWRQVHALLIEAARRTENVLAEPSPFVLQTSLDDFFVTYEVNAYTDRPNEIADTYSLLHANIQNTFNEGGVEIMSPHYTSLRDGNRVTIPASHLDPQYTAPAFRMAVTGTGLESLVSAGGAKRVPEQAR